ncbi:putative Alcohol dehydrogenase transcription factor Myb/SANT-like-containing protein 14 [Homarus americanus]|uniref:Putative Alcohol dehydrogenase transcription factor Myb/SANT-like-containing protein 14 n=1 Tax=Homarus americanus TaxID=6706 RepID=A0A8J5K8C5_HOMAM|nr:putative Alcohol dehydrogenase transcription factor Myb/SANT-like-containing protein 14 [Homarus americanus]
MEWTREQTILLIELYHSHRVLWDPTYVNYKNKIKRADAWRNIADALHLEKGEVEKMKNLIAQFRREMKKTKEQKSGDGAQDA